MDRLPAPRHARSPLAMGRTGETKDTQGGNIVTNWSIAIDKYVGEGRKETIWIDCAMWGERGEKVAEYLLKGTPVAVAGEIDYRTYESNGETRVQLTLNV